MKNLIVEYILIQIVCVAVAYLCGSFIAMDLNPANWHEAGRLIIMCLAVIVALLIVDIKEDDI